jgi:DNA-binding NtrC family response regulator
MGENRGSDFQEHRTGRARLLAPQENEGAMLAGYRVLVVDDEALVAEGIKDLLAEAEGVPVGPAPSVREAQHLIKVGPAVDAALLDVNLNDGPVTPVLKALSAWGVPTVIHRGGDVPEDVRQRHPELIALAKPVPPTRVIGELRKIIKASGPRPVER